MTVSDLLAMLNGVPSDTPVRVSTPEQEYKLYTAYVEDDVLKLEVLAVEEDNVVSDKQHSVHTFWRNEDDSYVAITIFWSDEDGSYIAIIPEFPGVSAFGDTREEALREAVVALEAAITTYQEEDWALPDGREGHDIVREK